MPYAVVTTSTPLSDAQRQQLHTGIGALLNSVLSKKADVTAIRIEETPASHWTIAGQTSPSAHLDVKVTEGTNNVTEIRTFIKQAHILMADVLGALPEASYVVVHELPATSWGYNGHTQAERAYAAPLSRRPALTA